MQNHRNVNYWNTASRKIYYDLHSANVGVGQNVIFPSLLNNISLKVNSTLSTSEKPLNDLNKI